MSPAPTSEQVARRGNSGRTSGGRTADSRIGNVDPPSGRYETFNGGNLFRIAVPSNWEELEGNNSVTFSPRGGFGDYRGQSVFTHGLQVGVEDTRARNLRTGTSELIQSLSENNPQLRQSGTFSNVNIDGRNGLATVLTNVSDVTGQAERIALYTTQMNDGRIFFVVGVAPAREFSNYRQVFNQSVRSLQLNDTYRSSRY
jgi:hypothetical protein